MEPLANAVLHHPHVINIPTIAEFRTKAKFIYLSSVFTSKDPMIADISGLLLEQEFSKNVHIPPEVNQLLVLARKSISSITSRTLLHQCRKVRQDSQVKRWNGKLNALTVQCKFRAWAITDLQSQPMSGNTSRMDCTLANFHFYCQQDLL